MDFLTLILTTGALFIRPEELFPQFRFNQIYEVFIVTCILCSFPSVVKQLSGPSLSEQPVTACVVGLMASVTVSGLVKSGVEGITDQAVEFSKVLIYYLLLVGDVNTPARLQRFLTWLVAFALLVTGISVLQYHGLGNFPAFNPLEEWMGVDEVTGEQLFNRRLRGGNTSVFDDPNDMCLLLVVCMAVCGYRVGGGHEPLLRALWLAPLGFFCYALVLTKSRGGLLALLVGLMVFLHARFGRTKAILLSVISVLALFAFLGGRQTDLDTSGGSGQARIQVWFEGLILFRYNPILGIGPSRFEGFIGHAAHSSFINCYTELGFIGGTIFLGAIFSALWMLRRLGQSPGLIDDPELRRMRPYLMAAIAAYSMGMMTLSRSYIIPTYIVLGLATAYQRVTGVDPAAVDTRLSGRLVQQIIVASLVFLIAIHAYVTLQARWN